jgi:hypothetical protein
MFVSPFCVVVPKRFSGGFSPNLCSSQRYKGTLKTGKNWFDAKLFRFFASLSFFLGRKNSMETYLRNVEILKDLIVSMKMLKQSKF